jgi:hypothetical protein
MLDAKTLYLSGGINRNVSPFLVADGEMSDIQNFTTTKIGVLKKTGDYTIKGTKMTVGGS